MKIKRIRVIVRSENQLIIDYSLKSMSEVINLTLEDTPFAKLIKHMIRGESDL